MRISSSSILWESVVKVVVSQRNGHGSGFFVAPGLVMTCAHVLVGATSSNDVIVYWRGREWAARVIAQVTQPYRDYSYPDLALLQTDIENHPILELATEVPMGKLTLFGFPGEDTERGGSEATFTVEGITNPLERPLIKLSQGQMLPGVSGSPLVNRESGLVIAVAKRTRDQYTDLGGWGIPVETVLQAFPDIIREVAHDQKPALRGSLAFRPSLPRTMSKLIGREEEAASLEDRLIASDTSLLSLVGAGGVGKTRLALEVASRVSHRFTNGVAFVDVGDARDASAIASRIATAMKLELSGAVPLEESLAMHLEDAAVVVVLDTCEYALDAVASVADFLRTRCPRLKLLATSRERLRVDGEECLEIRPFDVSAEPGDARELSSSNAVQLFLARAALIDRKVLNPERDAAAIYRICRRLDGIPLAIEMAASRLWDLRTVEQLEERLADFSKVLVQGMTTAPPRQRTMNATIDWSVGLLGAKEQSLFTRLGVFAGGWTLEMAEQVCAGSGLETDEVMNLQSELVNKSLVVVSTGPFGARYSQFDTVRFFSSRRLLESTEGSMMSAALTRYLLQVTRDAEPDLWGSAAKERCTELELESENMRTALRWSLEHDPPAAVELVSNLWRFWQLHCHFEEGFDWAERALSTGPKEATAARARAVLGMAYLARSLWRIDVAERLSRESMSLFEQLNDSRGQTMALSNLAITMRAQGKLADAASLFAQSLAQAQQSGDLRAQGSRLMNLGITSLWAGETASAQDYFDRSLTFLLQVEESHALSVCYRFYGKLYELLGDTAEAEVLYQKSLAQAQALGDLVGIGAALIELGSNAISAGRYDDAERRLGEGLTEIRKSGDSLEEAWGIHTMATLASKQGDLERFHTLNMQALRMMLRLVDIRGTARCLILAGVADLETQQWRRGVSTLAAVLGAMPESLLLQHPTDSGDFNRELDRARSTLGAEKYQEYWNVGETISVASAASARLFQQAGENIENEK
ncbi:tetratricopeptide repeat protein [Actinoplanes sp. KI2]|uniref:tetratricopeptide repeat protein n=1 Tax=Actinoplanes sp. KI2 TaxID=2983315 RepID=UPI0021D59C0A|nr:tetratricopeptide repeat protein [Actinoplanes sp. KI2]MCU7725623.1 tetratricopeptide repeat protein [Actinoplanes sp. KI2]